MSDKKYTKATVEVKVDVNLGLLLMVIKCLFTGKDIRVIREISQENIHEVEAK